ncbi:MULTISPECIES: hypothetical protein [Micromonospora]|uniref:hypothetical protein n=1 Tax=Micromonospora TaxID=1873 RepID=UPI0011B61CFF|nr:MULTISPECIES: hypothetical protein [unclassified Micromonospora]MBM0226240.1 hypothetical protein [Micromonospora sp. ATA51]
MTRQLLLVAAVLVAATACASTGTPPPPPNTATATGSESPTATPPLPSNAAGITSQEAARIAPLAPSQLTAVTDAATIRLTWPATGEDLAYYQCLRRANPDGQWLPVGRTPPAQHTYVDSNPGTGTHIYGVQAVNTSGLASPITESQPITIS